MKKELRAKVLKAIKGKNKGFIPELVMASNEDSYLERITATELTGNRIMDMGIIDRAPRVKNTEYEGVYPDFNMLFEGVNV